MSNQSGLAEVGESHGEAKYLLRHSVFNARVTQLYRSDYEARGLRAVKNAMTKVRLAFNRQNNPSELGVLTNALDKLLERERILLRIKLPSQERPQEREIASSSRPSIFITEKPKPATSASAEKPVDSSPAP